MIAIQRFGLAAALAAALGAGYIAGAQDKPAPLEVGQVLRVGDRIITAEDLIARIREAELGVPDDRKLLVPSLIYLRDAALLDLEAQRMGLVFTPEELGVCTQQQVDFAKETVRKQYHGVLPWDKWLEQTYGMTEAQFFEYVAERAAVILRRRVLVNWFMQSTEGIEVWRILVERQSDAEKIYNELKDAPGAERLSQFKSIAVQKSVDHGSNLNQGRVGRQYKNAWTIDPAEGEAALWALADNEVARPIKSRGGWSVLMRGQTFKPDVKPFAEMRDTLMKAPDPDASLSNTWVLHVGNTQKYPIVQRIPGLDCKPNQKGK